jgi:hypothetical protein
VRRGPIALADTHAAVVVGSAIEHVLRFKIGHSNERVIWRAPDLKARDIAWRLGIREAGGRTLAKFIHRLVVRQGCWRRPGGDKDASHSAMRPADGRVRDGNSPILKKLRQEIGYQKSVHSADSSRVIWLDRNKKQICCLPMRTPANCGWVTGGPHDA